ncbi:hypothetical protein DXC69_24900 [Paenibacillus polymyxa]|nr:hypothetical protein DXC69_24900 [Paenibacillus polymyxa]
MRLFGNKNEEVEYLPQDVLVVLQNDGTAAIAPIVDINDERVYAESMDGNYAVPKADVKAYTGPRGRIFMYPTITENVEDCQRIAALERNTVLRQITHFAPEVVEEGRRLPLGKIILIGGGILFFLILVISMVSK